MTDGYSTRHDGDVLIVSVSEPYKGVLSVNGYTISVAGETAERYYTKEFRYATDGVLYGEWSELNTENLSRLRLDTDNDFYPQYRLTQVGEGELTLESIALETTTIDGLINETPMCRVDSADGCCGVPNLVYECCGNSFNPYAVGATGTLYTQLCSVISNMFGFCVRYFKTSASQRSKDVILHEYSLENVIAQGTVKIVVPDNQLPTREINFNPLMMDFPTIFEVQIVKREFWSAFGEGTKPEVHDYLYFETYMNKMYEINAVSETDDYLYTGAYWRVSLVQYQQRSSVKFDTEELDLDTQTLIFSSDKFNVEVEKQEEDARKPRQYNTIGREGNDYVRRIIDKRLVIHDLPIYNKWTVVSKQRYVLDSVPHSGEMADPALVYRYNKGWDADAERMITLWVRPLDGKEHMMLAYGDNFALTQNAGGVRVELNGIGYDFVMEGDAVPMDGGSDSNECWYALVLAIKPKDHHIALWVYRLKGGNATNPRMRAMDSTLERIYYKRLDLYDSGALADDGDWCLYPCGAEVTNIRIWNSICEEEQHELILSQYVVKDMHLCELVDNAQAELMVGKVTNPR